MIAETHASLQDEFKCVLAPTIVDVSGRASTYLRVLNLSPDTVTISPDVVIGTLEEAIVDKTILEEESTSGRGDFSSIRQIVFEQSMSQSPASVEMPQKTKEECLVPDHL